VYVDFFPPVFLPIAKWQIAPPLKAKLLINANSTQPTEPQQPPQPLPAVIGLLPLALFRLPIRLRHPRKYGLVRRGWASRKPSGLFILLCDQLLMIDIFLANSFLGNFAEIDTIPISDPIRTEIMSNQQHPGPGAVSATRFMDTVNILQLRVAREEARNQNLEATITQLREQVDRLNQQIMVMNQQIMEQNAKLNEQAAIIKSKDEQNALLQEQMNQQAATIKHQSQLIQNPQTHHASLVRNRNIDNNPMVNTSQALVPTASNHINNSRDLTAGFEQIYRMAQTFARTHVNFVSSQKDGNMPESIKNALLAAAAPAQAFPFMSKPDSRYQLVAKLMITWINKEILTGISFGEFNAQAETVIKETRNKFWQGEHTVLYRNHYYMLTSPYRHTDRRQSYAHGRNR
jgi:hypothetical protein